MRIIATSSNEEMSRLAASIVIGHMCQDKRVNISLTGARTPERMLEILIDEVKDREFFSHVNYYLFDDTPVYNKEGEEIAALNSLALNKQFFEPANIDESQIVRMTKDNYLNYDQMIEEAGGLDCMVIGVGADGHFCANMPETTHFNQTSYRVDLSKDYPWNQGEAIAVEKEFGEGAYVDYMYTMGPRSLMKVKHLVLIANTLEKAQVIKDLIDGPVTEDLPVSVLKLHPNLTVLCDDEASSLLKKD